MPRRPGNRRSAASRAQQDALALLQADHERIVGLFVRAARGSSSLDTRAGLLEHACRELEAHSKIEEELFYPAIRHEIGDPAWIEESAVEHATLDALMEELRGLGPADGKAVATATVLAEFLGHHLDKEERRIFPLARRAGVDLAGLGELIRHRYEDILAQRAPMRAPPGAGSPARRGAGTRYSGFAPF